MAILMFTARKHELRSKINKNQARLLELSRKLSDLQQYASSIGDGAVSIYDMMNVPSSMFMRTAMFMGMSHNVALQNAQMNMANLPPIIQQQLATMDPQSQQMQLAWMQQNMYKQERERIAKMETQLLNQQEKQIQQEKDKLESLIQLDTQELEAVKQAEEKGIKDFAPKYVA